MRPAYHFAPAANWLSDPNGLVFLDGEWHLFYQYNPYGDQWGHMAWGHAISRDLAIWAELPPALLEDDRHLIFSGSAVVDIEGRAGFGKGAMVAAYTGAARDGTHQVQCLAASGDGGRSWTKFAGNPVLDRGMADFRDPNVFWHAASGRWIMIVALSAENRALIFGSDDLRAWEELSAIGPFDLAGRIWECPLLIELPVEDSDATRWLFKVDLLHGGPGSGAVAVAGVFDGRTFVPDRCTDGGIDWDIVDGGRDFYAAIAWHAPRDGAGRPCWIGWMGNHAYQASLPARGWRGAMSLPRRIALRRNGERFRLVQTVEPALVSAFEAGAPIGIAVRDFSMPTASRISIETGNARILTVRLSQGDRTVTVRFADGMLRLTRDAGIAPAFDAPIEAHISMAQDITLWLDHGSIEIEGEGGARWITAQLDLPGEQVSLSIYGDVTVTPASAI